MHRIKPSHVYRIITVEIAIPTDGYRWEITDALNEMFNDNMEHASPTMGDYRYTGEEFVAVTPPNVDAGSEWETIIFELPRVPTPSSIAVLARQTYDRLSYINMATATSCMHLKELLQYDPRYKKGRN